MHSLCIRFLLSKHELRSGSCPRGVYAIARGDSQVSLFCFPALLRFGSLRVQLGLEFGNHAGSALAARVPQHFPQSECRDAGAECNPELDQRIHHNLYGKRRLVGRPAVGRVDERHASGREFPELYAGLHRTWRHDLKNRCPCTGRSLLCHPGGEGATCRDLSRHCRRPSRGCGRHCGRQALQR